MLSAASAKVSCGMLPNPDGGMQLARETRKRGRKRKNSWGKQEKNKWRREEESKWETAAGGVNRSDTIRRNQRITGESSGK